MASPPKSSGLNPDMVYTPLNPQPAAARPGRDNDNDTSLLHIDGGSEDPQFTFRLRLARTVRLFLFCFTVITMLSPRHAGPFDVIWIILIWHLAQLLSHFGGGHKKRGGGGLWCLPKISLQIGQSYCEVGGDGDDDDDHKQPPKKKKRSLYGLVALIDFIFGVTVLVFGCLTVYIVGGVLSIILGCFMIILSFASLFKVYHTVAFEFSVYKDGTTQPIALGSCSPDEELASSRRRGGLISVSA